MKKLWVSAVPYNKEVVISALESGVEVVVLADGKSETVRGFGKAIASQMGGYTLTDEMPASRVVLLSKDGVRGTIPGCD